MDAQDLKALQAPLKQQYREDPGAAVITLNAQGSLTEGISCSAWNSSIEPTVSSWLWPA